MIKTHNTEMNPCNLQVNGHKPGLESRVFRAAAFLTLLASLGEPPWEIFTGWQGSLNLEKTNYKYVHY